MRVKCECGHKARITNRNEYSPHIAKLYCQCQDVRCGHTFVMDLSFSHSIRPPSSSIDQLLFDQLKTLSSHDRNRLIHRLQMAD